MWQRCWPALVLLRALLPLCLAADDWPARAPPSFQFSDDAEAGQTIPLPGGGSSEMHADAVDGDGEGDGDGQVLSLPWQPGPQEYTIKGTPDAPSTLSLYPPGGPVGVSVGGDLATLLREAAGDVWHLVELYDHACPHCWYAVPAMTEVANAFAGQRDLVVTSINCHAQANAETCLYLELMTGTMDYPTVLLCLPSDLKDKEVLELPTTANDLKEHLEGDELASFMALSQCHFRYEAQSSEDEQEPLLDGAFLAGWIKSKTGFQVNSSALSKGADFTRADIPSVNGAPYAPGWRFDSQDGEAGVPRFEPWQRWYDALTGFAELVYFNAHHADKLDAAIAAARFLGGAFPTQAASSADSLGEESGTTDARRQAAATSNFGELADALGQVAKAAKGEGTIQKRLHAAVENWTRQYALGDPRNSIDEERGSEIARFQTCTNTNCAMWSLLHVTTAAVAARGMSGQPLRGEVSTSATGASRGLIKACKAVMDFARLLVSNFLACRQCKDSFLEEFDACSFGRCNVTDWRGLPLWLWRAHNAVSLEQAARERVAVDRRWPGYQDCPACWREQVALGGVVSKVAHETARGLGSDRSKRQQSKASPTLPGKDPNEWDAVFETGHVFWHMVGIYIGVGRVDFDLDDLPADEQEKVQGLLQWEQGRNTNLPSSSTPPASMARTSTSRGRRESTAVPQPPAEDCQDDLVFADGFAGQPPNWNGRCEDWVSFDCDRAVEDWGYSQSGEEELVRRCPRSCGLCGSDAGHSGHNFVGACVLVLVVAAVCLYLGGSSQNPRYSGQLGSQRVPRLRSPLQASAGVGRDDRDALVEVGGQRGKGPGGAAPLSMMSRSPQGGNPIARDEDEDETAQE